MVDLGPLRTIQVFVLPAEELGPNPQNPHDWLLKPRLHGGLEPALQHLVAGWRVLNERVQLLCHGILPSQNFQTLRPVLTRP